MANNIFFLCSPDGYLPRGEITREAGLCAQKGDFYLEKGSTGYWQRENAFRRRLGWNIKVRAHRSEQQNVRDLKNVDLFQFE